MFLDFLEAYPWQTWSKLSFSRWPPQENAEKFKKMSAAQIQSITDE